MFLSLDLGYVTKQCLANGTWFIQNGKEWSNFGNCARDDVCKRLICCDFQFLYCVQILNFRRLFWEESSRKMVSEEGIRILREKCI